MTKKLIAMTLALLVVPAFVQPAAADQPKINRLELKGSFDDPTGLGCGFPLTIEFEWKVTQKTFLDHTGTPDRFQLHFRATNTITNPDNGKFLTAHNSWVRFFDLPSQETITEVGVAPLIKDTSGATVLVDAGRIIYDANGNILFQAGPHPFVAAGGSPPPSLCAELL